MTIHLNDYSRKNLLNVAEKLQQFYSCGHSATKDAVIDIYRAFSKIVKVINFDNRTKGYLLTKSGADELTEAALLQEIENVKNNMQNWKGETWSADYPLRCILVSLRDGVIIYPDNRGVFKKFFKINEPTEYERQVYEEKILEPVALNLMKIVELYYSQEKFTHSRFAI